MEGQPLSAEEIFSRVPLKGFAGQNPESEVPSPQADGLNVRWPKALPSPRVPGGLVGLGSQT